jgi:hypothetical protein
MLADRLAPSLRGRLAVHHARYRTSLEEQGRIWIQIDGREVAAFKTLPAERRRRQITDQLMDANNAWGSPAAYTAADRLAGELLVKAGEQSDYAAWSDLEGYLSLAIDDALDSSSPLIRALAIADRRTGKRRLRDLHIGPRDHPLVREVWATRCKAEGITDQEADV